MMARRGYQSSDDESQSYRTGVTVHTRNNLSSSARLGFPQVISSEHTGFNSVAASSNTFSGAIVRPWHNPDSAFMETSTNIRPSKRMTSTIRESMRKSKTRASKIEIKEAVAKILTGNSKEQRLIREIAAMINLRQNVIAYISIGSIGLGVCVNELCVAGDYRSTERSDEEERLFQEQIFEGRVCIGAIPLILKIVQSLLTAVLVGLMIVQHKLDLRSKNASLNALQGNEGFSDAYTATWQMKTHLALGILVSSIHTAPFIRYDISTEMLGERIYYRLDSMLCALMFVRLYHVWRNLVLKVNYLYFNIEESVVLRDNKTIRILQQSPISLSFLALKVAIKRHPARMISTLTMSVIMAVGYILRIAEGPAQQKHSVYLWDQFWLIFVTLTTTGYGDFYAHTHIGRFACCVAMGVGPVIVAFITATITQSLGLSSDEEFIMKRMDCNSLKYQVMELSARIIQLWWTNTAHYAHRHRVRGRSPTARRKSSCRLVNSKNWNFRRSATDKHNGSKADYSQETKNKMTELYRKLYLAINALRRFHLASVPLTVQFNSEESQEDRSAGLLARTGVDDTLVALRHSVRPAALEEMADVRQHVAQLRSEVSRVCSTVQRLEWFLCICVP